ncbi:MAG: hypothetical protein QOH17_159, partial [Pseudonocardiales bacterium]|nr:hypothetical protein [Pseudonocardiales bacterium]
QRALSVPLLVGALGLALAACGGGSTTSDAAPASAAPNAGPPGTTGTIAAVAATSLQVQNARAGKVTVDFSGTTTITRTVAGAAADVKAGDCVAVMSGAANGAAATTSGPVAATVVTVSPASGQGCRSAMGMGGGGGGGARPSAGAQPSGANGARRPRGTVGTVGAVAASSFTVLDTNGTTTVTTSSSTTYLKTESADKSALVVGQCATAVGQAASGTVTATAISVRAPGANGCGGTGGGRGQGMGGQPTATS